MWRHEFEVTVNPCDSTFSGVALTRGRRPVHRERHRLVQDGSFATDPIGGGAQVTNAPMDNTTVRNVGTTWTANEIEFRISKARPTNTSNYKNHGQYVKAMGGGDDAAHSCIGMPINSNRSSSRPTAD